MAACPLGPAQSYIMEDNAFKISSCIVLSWIFMQVYFYHTLCTCHKQKEMAISSYIALPHIGNASISVIGLSSADTENHRYSVLIN